VALKLLGFSVAQFCCRIPGMKTVKTRPPMGAIRREVEGDVRKYRREFLMWLGENVAPTEQASAMLAFLEITLDWCIDTFGEEEGRRFVESVYGRVAAKRRRPLQ
jgi:hypothetical protein